MAMKAVKISDEAVEEFQIPVIDRVDQEDLELLGPAGVLNKLTSPIMNRAWK